MEETDGLEILNKGSLRRVGRKKLRKKRRWRERRKYGKEGITPRNMSMKEGRRKNMMSNLSKRGRKQREK